jgi:hypothetical protein
LYALLELKPAPRSSKDAPPPKNISLRLIADHVALNLKDDEPAMAVEPSCTVNVAVHPEYIQLDMVHSSVDSSGELPENSWMFDPHVNLQLYIPLPGENPEPETVTT